MCTDTTKEMLEVMRKTASGLTTAQQLKAVEKEILDFQMSILQSQRNVRLCGDFLEGATLTADQLDEYESMLRHRDQLKSQLRSVKEHS
jgi:hypothetical protein